MKKDSKLFGLLITVVLLAVSIALAHWRPGYFSNVRVLGGALLAQVLIVTVWHYEKWFFAVMMLMFLWAGTDLPLAGVGTQGRWIFLGVGALVGVVKWAQRERERHFSAMHLLALLCVLSAAVSALVSRRMEISLLKSASFFLLFLYVSCGGRIAVLGRECAFFSGLVTACELTAYFSVVFYWGLHFGVFGNPNALGAVMGVVVVPILLWAVVSTEQRQQRHRLSFALLLAALLLYTSVSRAGILACAVAVTVMCIVLRRQHLLIKGAFALAFFVGAVAVIQPSKFDELVNSFTENIIYKGKREQGILGSRETPWQQTIEVIKESPWFGTGFGTDLPQETPGPGSVFSTTADLAREHGNSYLALLDYVGLLGVFPFVILLAVIVHHIYRSCSWIRRTRNVQSFVIPIVLVCIAGLVHAFFEDWLFAVGFHLNVLFWTAAFLIAELQTEASAKEVTYGRLGDRAKTATQLTYPSLDDAPVH